LQTKIHDRRMAKFVFRVDAVNGHAGANHVEESFRMLEKTEAGGGVFFPSAMPSFPEWRSLVKAAELLLSKSESS